MVDEIKKTSTARPKKAKKSKKKPRLSRAARAQINRTNSRLSTGPKTERGKSRAKMNALKHGLRALVVPLPGEDAAELLAMIDHWNDHYQPRTPAEFMNLTIAVTSAVQVKRGYKFLAAEQAKSVRNAFRNWDQAREDELHQLIKRLETEPRAALDAINRTGHGCHWLAKRWQRLLNLLDNPESVFAVADRNEMLHLLGLSTDLNPRSGADEARRINRMLVGLYPNIKQEEFDHSDYDHRQHLLKDMQDQELEERYSNGSIPKPPDRDAWADDPIQARTYLRACIVRHLGPLKERAEYLLATYEEPDRAGAADRALLPEGTAGANYLRYLKSHESSYHRSFNAFQKLREQSDPPAHERASEPIPSEPAAPARPAGPGEVEYLDVSGSMRTSYARPIVERLDPGRIVSPRPKRLAKALAPNEAKRRRRPAVSLRRPWTKLNPRPSKPAPAPAPSAAAPPLAAAPEPAPGSEPISPL